MAEQPLSGSETVDDLITRGKALIAQKQYAEALLVFERATQLAPQNFSAWFNVGYTLLLLKRYAEALPAHERATALDHNSTVAWYNKGTAFSELQRYDEALAAFDQALALEPNNANAWYNKGLVLSKLERYDECLVAYERCFGPTAASDWQARARVLHTLGRTREAEAAERRAKELGG